MKLELQVTYKPFALHAGGHNFSDVEVPELVILTSARQSAVF